MSMPRRALLILAHPDDPEFLAGGTIAGWTTAGWEIGYVLLTDGGGGTEDPTMTRERLRAIRQAEQHAAAKTLGVGDVHFLHYSDCGLQHTLELRREIVRHVRRFRPDLVLCFDPATRWFPDYVNHPDHWISGEAALAAVFPAARERLVYPELLAEGLDPHKVMEIWLVASSQPNHWVDISATLDRKIMAMRCHQSQVGDGHEVAETLRRRAAAAGAGAAPPLAAAEEFRVIQMRR